MRRMLATGLAQDRGPFAMRYPRGAAPAFAEVPLTPLSIGKVAVVREGSDVAILAVGKMVPVALAAAELLAAEGIYPTVVDARFIKPIDVEIAEIAREHSAVITIEDGVYNGGFGSAVLELLAVSGVERPVQTLGLPDRFVEHGAQAKLLNRYGLDADGVVQAVRRASSRSGTPRFALVR
jgi:1-deoxy-D-xylulose-5-phosphate synthase